MVKDLAWAQPVATTSPWSPPVGIVLNLRWAEGAVQCQQRRRTRANLARTSTHPGATTCDWMQGGVSDGDVHPPPGLGARNMARLPVGATQRLGRRIVAQRVGEPRQPLAALQQEAAGATTGEAAAGHLPGGAGAEGHPAPLPDAAAAAEQLLLPRQLQQQESDAEQQPADAPGESGAAAARAEEQARPGAAAAVSDDFKTPPNWQYDNAWLNSLRLQVRAGAVRGVGCGHGGQRGVCQGASAWFAAAVPQGSRQQGRNASQTTPRRVFGVFLGGGGQAAQPCGCASLVCRWWMPRRPWMPAIRRPPSPTAALSRRCWSSRWKWAGGLSY